MIGLNGPLVALLLGAYVVLNACAIGFCRAASEGDRAAEHARAVARDDELARRRVLRAANRPAAPVPRPAPGSPRRSA